MTRFLGSMTEWRVVVKESTGCWWKGEVEIKSGTYFGIMCLFCSIHDCINYNCGNSILKI